MKKYSNAYLNYNTIDLTGKRFSKLLVLEFDHKKQVINKNGRKRNHYYWKCKCDCGNEVIRAGDSLRDCRTQSCGCSRNVKEINTENLIGKRFGKLIVLELAYKKRANSVKKHNNYYWKCRCDCGNEVIRMGSSLKRGHTESCGCERLYKLNLICDKKSNFVIKII